MGMKAKIQSRLERVESMLGYYDQFYDLSFEEEMEYSELVKERRELLRILTDVVPGYREHI